MLNSGLIRVVEELKAKRIIKKDVDIANVTGYSRGIISNYITGKTLASKNFIQTFEDKYNVKIQTDYDDISKKSYPLNEGENKTFQEQLLSYKNKDKEIPVIGGFTNLSNIEVYNDEKREIVGTLPQNVFPGCDYSERAKGDSMYPLIMNQALLVGKTCNKDGIVWGEKYIIKTKTGLDTTKFIHPVEGDESKLELKAHNKSIPPQKINIDDIVFCCRVHWIINPT